VVPGRPLVERPLARGMNTDASLGVQLDEGLAVAAPPLEGAMLDAFIIEQIRRRDEERRHPHPQHQPQLEPPGRSPLDRPPRWEGDGRRSDDEDGDGRVVFDM